MDIILSSLKDSWHIIAQFAPYLLLGFVVASFLQYLIPEDFIVKQLGKKGFLSILRSTLWGIPLPLCSFSVIPVASSIKNSGASKGSTIAFLSATPQTGVDSLLATAALLGWPFAIIKLIIAFIAGIISGVLVDFIDTKKENKFIEFDFCPLLNKKKNLKENSLKYFFITLPLDLYKPLLIGILIAGFIPNLIQSNLPSYLSDGFYSFLSMTFISLPLYVCAVESIPVAYTFLLKGISLGSILIFLIIGPATNSATILAAMKIIGKKSTFIYIFTLVLIAWFSAYLIDGYLFNLEIEPPKDHHLHLNLLNHISGIFLILYFLNAVFNKKIKSFLN